MFSALLAAYLTTVLTMIGIVLVRAMEPDPEDLAVPPETIMAGMVMVAMVTGLAAGAVVLGMGTPMVATTMAATGATTTTVAILRRM